MPYNTIDHNDEQSSSAPPPLPPQRGERPRLPPWVVILIVALAAFGAGYLLRSVAGPSVDPLAEINGDNDRAAADTEWTCSMHPQIRRIVPGLCPLCNMDLIPVDDTPETGFTTTERGKALMEIRTEPVRRAIATRNVRMTGAIAVDDSRRATIAARMPGRIDRLFADTTGIPVRAGDHMVELYSPELLSAQQELIQARRSVDTLPPGDTGMVRQTATITLNAAREKLRLWGLTPEQVGDIERKGEPSDRLTLYAPIGGIVIDLNVREGEYVRTGDRLFSIADLSYVWVRLDAYESDLPWIRYGQRVAITPEASPGDTFEGRISFVQPTLDEATRTVRVRVTVPNARGRLKPGMFVRAIVHSTMTADGRAVAPDLAGKFISPMHPEIVSDEPGNCTVCGMPLERAEDLGFVSQDDLEPGDMPLIIPASAPLITGRRAVVYVEDPDAEQPTYEGREIVLGPRAGDYYIVKEGLREGERVVAHGAFKIDSALQLVAKPSMMTLLAEETRPVVETVAVDGPAAQQVIALWQGYLRWRKALSDDDTQGAAEALEALKAAMDEAGADAFALDKQDAWRETAQPLRRALAGIERPGDIESQRVGFEPVSRALRAMLQRIDADGLGPVYVLHCPMAFNDRGADWLDNKDEVENPYFGAAMYRCGVVTETIRSDGAPDAPQHGDAPEPQVVRVDGAAADQVKTVWQRYLVWRTALAADETDNAARAATALKTAAAEADAGALPEAASAVWAAAVGEIAGAVDGIERFDDIEEQRRQFEPVSGAMEALLRRIDAAGLGPVYVLHCPMAFNDRGADWLDNKQQVDNPYEGARMRRCGMVKETIRR